MKSSYHIKSYPLKPIIIAFVISVISAAGSAFWAEKVNSTCHQGVGLGIGFPCDSFFTVIQVGFTAGLISALLIFYFFKFPQKWLLLIPLLQVILFIPLAVWSQDIYSGHQNAVALKQLNRDTAKIDYSVYLPSYVPSGFKSTGFTGGKDSSSVGYLNISSANPTVSINILEAKLLNGYNPPVDCGQRYLNSGTCTYIGSDNWGDSIYLGRDTTGTGIPYITAHNDTYIMLTTNPNSSVPLSVILKIFNSFSQKSIEQLQQLNG